MSEQKPMTTEELRVLARERHVPRNIEPRAGYIDDDGVFVITDARLLYISIQHEPGTGYVTSEKEATDG